MAVDSSGEGEPQIGKFLDKCCSLPVSCSSLKLLKSSVENVNQQFSLETLPILIEDTSFPAGLDCSFHCSPSPDICSISVLPEESSNPECAPPLAFVSIVEVPNPSKNQMCVDSELNCQNCIDFQMTGEEVYSQCIVDIPTENEYSKSTESNEDAVETFKSKSVLIRMLQGQVDLLVSGKPMQLLMNFITSRDKSVIERIHDIPNNRWRRYKRTASFDSRKIALLFSILSSLGTLVLIYLTLRVRQKGDGFVHI
ncbi:Adenine deaminase [Quillaja saponaria]|uniref:Adenine deaminase n=1 Tax=Quillaja saponaria TaxID=32244 RepID=A0AAD7LGT2_QUISA|nr:Adenine deaminase [Quillaja saponaria]